MIASSKTAGSVRRAHAAALASAATASLPATNSCDDENADDEDGCSPICQLEPGFACDGEPSLCTPTVCGDGDPEGSEQCDNDVVTTGAPSPFDGCSAQCTWEPDCGCDGCDDVCGDGMKFTTEDCDDGNLNNGDGCNSDCEFEPGYSCVDEVFDGHPAVRWQRQPAVPSLAASYTAISAATTAVAAPAARVRRTRILILALSRSAMCACRASLSRISATRASRSTTPPCSSASSAGRTMNGAAPVAATSGPLSVAQIEDRFEEWYTDAAANVRIPRTLFSAQAMPMDLNSTTPASIRLMARATATSPSRARRWNAQLSLHQRDALLVSTTRAGKCWSSGAMMTSGYS